MVVFEELSKKRQNIVTKYLLAKKALSKAELMEKQCRDTLIKTFCEEKGLTAEKIVHQEENFEIMITSGTRADTSWASAWKEFDKMFGNLVQSDDFLYGEYLKARRAAEINNTKSPYLRWEVRKKDGGGNGA